MDKDITRRTFAATGLVTGFTLATGPLNAAAIVTDTRGIDAGEVSVAVADGHIPAYRARPERRHDAPVVLVVQEIFGVHEHIKDLCRRLARPAITPSRRRSMRASAIPGKYDMAHAKDLMTDIVSRVPGQRSDERSGFDGGVRQRRRRGCGEARDHRFLLGGRVVWLYTAHSRDVKAGVAWYGPLAGTPNALRPHTATELAGDLHAPVLGLYAGLDKGITAADIDAMRAALAKTGKTASRIDVFPDAQHGFNADYRDSYNEKDAKDAGHGCWPGSRRTVSPSARTPGLRWRSRSGRSTTRRRARRGHAHVGDGAHHFLGVTLGGGLRQLHRRDRAARRRHRDDGEACARARLQRLAQRPHRGSVDSRRSGDRSGSRPAAFLGGDLHDARHLRRRIAAPSSAP